MENTHTKQSQSFEDIAKRTAFSFFLFSLVLAGLLMLSWYVLVPQLTHVEVNGSVRGLQELKSYKAGLEAQITRMEDERGTFLLPVDNDVYVRLKLMKESRLHFERFRSDLLHIMKNIVPDQKNAVKLQSFVFDTENNITEIRGEVRNVGPRSMTVLAQFVEQLHALPTVFDVETSRYTREESSEYGFYSPFVLRLTMNNAKN
ncbi:hypothetical protein COU75_04515 [Candidatus Peregrinibacteria bacterium CG10_big_fil_rev_8_21_14_0_10_42_8]|nr:MAG: hypothetical protein COU75_04515 [Candidatus Peregrinibacteria bacterium CG10_big_fil_rev_8_21_14_0_10_42_8]